MLIGTLTGCAGNETQKENNNTDIIGESTSETSNADNVESVDDVDNVDSDTVTIPHSYANASEGIELRMSNTDYFEKMTQNNLDYRVGKKGATLDEFNHRRV